MEHNIKMILEQVDELTQVNQKMFSDKLLISKLAEVSSIFALEANKFPGVIALNKESLVSSDFTGRGESCIIDQNKMKLINGKFLKMVSWYDNEWAYGNRVLDVAKLISGK